MSDARIVTDRDEMADLLMDGWGLIATGTLYATEGNLAYYVLVPGDPPSNAVRAITDSPDAQAFFEYRRKLAESLRE